MQRLQHISVADCANYPWWRGLSSVGIFLFAGNMGILDVTSRHTRFTNVVSIVLRIAVRKFVYGNKLNVKWSLENLWTEQKAVILMKKLVQQFSKPANLVLDTFARTLSTSRPYSLLDKHWRFFGCEGIVIAKRSRWQGFWKFILVSC